MVKFYIYLSNPSQKQFHFRHFHTFPSYLHVFFYFLIMFFSPQILVEISGLSAEKLYSRNIYPYYIYNMFFIHFGPKKSSLSGKCGPWRGVCWCRENQREERWLLMLCPCTFDGTKICSNTYPILY